MAIGRKVVGPTALSSTTAQLVGGAALTLPEAAKCILGIKIACSSPAGNTAGEPIAAKVYLESQDFPFIGPFEVLAQPIGSTLLKSISQIQGPNIEYPINCRAQGDKKIGGSRLKVYAAGLFNHTIEPYVAVEVIFADFIPRDKRGRPLPQYFSQLGTFTNTGTAAGEASGGTITIVGGRRIKEVFGYAVGTTVAALKGIMGKFRLNSSGILDFGDIEFLINPASGQVDTDIMESVAAVARSKVDIRIKSKLDITNFFNLGVALTTTGNFICGILYT